MNAKYSLPSRMRHLRIDRGVTQEHLGNEVGVSRTSISLYENGEMMPTITTAILIADYFGVSLGSLIGTEPLVIE